MKRLYLLCLLALLPIPFLSANSEDPVPAGFEHWTSSSLKPVVQALASQAAGDAHHSAMKQLADFPNESIPEVHREADGQIEWHETQSDIFFVQSGTATLLVGGTYLNGETTAPHEKRNGTIQGGVRQKLAPGDVVRIPAKVPHQVLLDGGREFTYLVVKAKGY
jgi:mannose-6-phosphate isomerase-like protein (cupin superfamily)